MNQLDLFGTPEPIHEAPQPSMTPVEQAISMSTAEGETIRPPSRDDMELHPKDYDDYKKLMTRNLGKWKTRDGGYFEFPFPAQPFLDRLRGGERPNYKQEWDYFPTPEEVVQAMFNMEICLYDGIFLEPSAGRGGIVDWIETQGAPGFNHTWHVIEPEPTNRAVLEADSRVELIAADFDAWTPGAVYDVVYANPPFKRDIQHVRKMLTCARFGGGSVVCVLPSMFPQKHAEEIDTWRPGWEYIGFYPLQERAFKSSGTGVSTVIMHANHRGQP